MRVAVGAVWNARSDDLRKSAEFEGSGFGGNRCASGVKAAARTYRLEQDDILCAVRHTIDYTMWFQVHVTHESRALECDELTTNGDETGHGRGLVAAWSSLVASR